LNYKKKQDVREALEYETLEETLNLNRLRELKEQKMKQTFKIDIVSDVVCPWCYIGKRRLDKAVAALSQQYDFKLYYHPFELHPELPASGQNQKEYLMKKFGGESTFRQLTGNVTRIAQSEGLHFDFDKQKVMPNTRKAHVIISGANEMGKQAAVSESFFDSYFCRGIDLSSEENLITVGIGAGLERKQIETWLADESRFRHVEQNEKQFSSMGIHAVPFYILNDRYSMSGAQPTQTFINALQEVGSKSAIETESSCSADGYC
jgi:predicted DsbA family dithiol-disulfide isomerase